MGTDIIVSLDGSSCTSITGALRLAQVLPPGKVRILVASGTYREKLKLSRPGLTIEGSGSGPEDVRIEYDDHAKRLLPDGEPMGTFNSWVVFAGAPGISLVNLTIENTAGDGRIAGQAVALYADSDALVVESCRLLARQDTLCTGPLPKDPVPKGVNLLHPVAGLGNDEPRLPFRQIFGNCLIAGDVDFIFGSAAVLFMNCEIRSLDRGSDDTFISAPSTYPGQNTGFLFVDCNLTFGEEGTDKARRGKVYLGRPWRPCAKTCFSDCRMGEHIVAEGWDDWEKPEARTLSYFGERGSTGPGANSRSRVGWAHVPDPAIIRRMREEITSFSRE